MHQIENVCGVKMPIFEDRSVKDWVEDNYGNLSAWLTAQKNGDKNSYWKVSNADLSRAENVVCSNIVGRQRLTLKNSKVIEAFFDIESNNNAETRSQVNKYYEHLRKAAFRVYYILNNRFKIPEDYIIIKSSGKGYHISVFFANTSEQEFNEYILTLLYCIDLPNSKSTATNKPWTFGLDLAVTLREGKIRDFGGEHEKLGEYHFCSLVKPSELMLSTKYPFCDCVDSVAYPIIKLFTPTPEFKQRIALYQIPITKTEVQRDASPPNYNKDGNPDKLCNCPLVASLIAKAGQQHHLLHQERIFLSQLYTFFGERGEQKLHEIISKCSDYDEGYTQMQIDWVKRHDRKPITCDWAKMRVGCPPCKGSGGKSPIKFVFRKELKR